MAFLKPTSGGKRIAIVRKEQLDQFYLFIYYLESESLSKLLPINSVNLKLWTAAFLIEALHAQTKHLNKYVNIIFINFYPM